MFRYVSIILPFLCRLVSVYSNNSIDSNSDDGLVNDLEPTDKIATFPPHLQVVKEAPHKVKDDERIVNFMTHTLERSSNFLQSLANRHENEKINENIPKILKAYQVLFKKFIDKTKDTNIRTKIGTERVILNTIDTSSRLMSRLINYLIASTEEEKPISKNIKNSFENEVIDEMDSEYLEACRVFGICRTVQVFSDYVIGLITEVVKLNSDKMMELTKTIFDYIDRVEMPRDPDAKIGIQVTAKAFKSKSPEEVRSKLIILKNLLMRRYEPIVSADSKTELSIVAIISVFNAMDTKIPASESNVSIWNKNIITLKRWGEGREGRVEDIVKSIFSNIFLLLYPSDFNKLNVTSTFNA